MRLKGWKTGAVRDAVSYARNMDITIEYEDGLHDMEGLIAITQREGSGTLIAPTREGDSGALVEDRDGNAIGMVVAGSDILSFVIPINEVLTAFNTEPQTA